MDVQPDRAGRPDQGIGVFHDPSFESYACRERSQHPRWTKRLWQFGRSRAKSGRPCRLVNFQFTEHARTDITLSNASVPENWAGAVVGTLATVDVDPGESHLYSLTNDPTGKFEIVGDTLKLKDGISLDYETMSDPHVTLTIRSADNPGGLFVEKQFTISVLDRPESMIVLPSVCSR